MDVTAAALAAELCGAPKADTLLEALCAAAEQAWSRRLKSGVDADDCGGALVCAAAFTAAADYLGGQAGAAESFTVGDVTVRSASGSALAQAKALRETAERLMAPYADSVCFCFKGVRG